MKAMIVVLSPKECATLFAGDLSILVRQKFPKDFVGWVYIYCAKNGNDCYGMPTDLVDYRGCAIYNKLKLMPKGAKLTTDDNQPRLNGKVVARFWCDKVEEHRPFFHWCIEKETCLTRDDVLDYLDSKDKFVGNPKRQCKVSAIHITKLEIFDKPKELKNFLIYSHTISGIGFKGEPKEFKVLKPLTRAPQSWQYIEVDEC